jgi:hypothetical protein
MPNLPATDLRQNVLTLAVPDERLPGVGFCMRSLLPAEDYDPGFQGQYLQTSYFDTPAFTLRRARLKKKKYLTIRIRCYAPSQQPGRNYPPGTYALSLKTEDGKYRTELPSYQAENLLVNGIEDLGDLGVPADLLARALDLIGDQQLQAAVTVSFLRYAVESSTDRLTLDTAITTSTGKIYWTNVLEVKTTSKPYQPPPEVTRWALSPIKLSKFLWATSPQAR